MAMKQRISGYDSSVQERRKMEEANSSPRNSAISILHDLTLKWRVVSLVRLPRDIDYPLVGAGRLLDSRKAANEPSFKKEKQKKKGDKGVARKGQKTTKGRQQRLLGTTKKGQKPTPTTKTTKATRKTFNVFDDRIVTGGADHFVPTKKKESQGVVPQPDIDKLVVVTREQAFVTIQGDEPAIDVIPRESTTNLPPKKEGKGGLIAGIVSVILLLLIGTGIFAFLWYKRRNTKQDKKGEPGAVPAAVAPTAPVPPAHQSEWAPDLISATQFKFKGPVQVHAVQPPLNLKHELEDVAIESPKSQEHIVFDDNLNEVHEIGSEVEIVVDPQGVPHSREPHVAPDQDHDHDHEAE